MLKVVLFSDKGRRPLTIAIHAPSDKAVKADPNKYISQAITRLCLKKGLTPANLRAYGYKRVAVQPFEPGSLAQQNNEQYSKLRKEFGWS